MRADIARQRYRERHIEPGLPAAPGDRALWRYALVIPAYRESPRLLRSLHELARGGERFLAILVVNRPDSDGDSRCNSELLSAVRALPACPFRGGNTGETYELEGGSALLLQDTERHPGPLPASQGVGLARKIGCDIAWRWIVEGAIERHWIFCSDADTLLPPDYFQRAGALHTDAVAAVYPFRHKPGPDPLCNRATALYELRLHHYVLGLEYAGSPYAYHTLGSCLAVRADAYARVRGFPRRSGGEDFYLLGKLRKLGPVARLTGTCIELQSRESQRVPFGTGPAVARIADAGGSGALFYHPQCFSALGALLSTVAGNYPAAGSGLADQMESCELPRHLARLSADTLAEMGWHKALLHCTRHSSNRSQFLRHFHQWFDAFRTLKFIHALRDRGLPLQTLEELDSLHPDLWPRRGNGESLSDAIRKHWQWTIPDRSRW